MARVLRRSKHAQKGFGMSWPLLTSLAMVYTLWVGGVQDSKDRVNNVCHSGAASGLGRTACIPPQVLETARSAAAAACPLVREAPRRWDLSRSRSPTG
jgi:hypothetical protein